MADIKGSLAGYVAEKIKCGTTSNGVGGDFQHAMQLAHTMVWDCGMGPSGLVGSYRMIPDSASSNHLSEAVKQKLNQESQDILQMCMKEVEVLLKKENVLLERFAKELIERGELDFDDIEAIFKEYGKSNPRVSEKFIPKTS